MNPLTSSSVSFQASLSSAFHLTKTKNSLLNLLSDSSQSVDVALKSASQNELIKHTNRDRREAQSFRSAMNVLSDHKLTLSMASNSPAASTSSSKSDQQKIQQTLSQLSSNIHELQNYLDSRL